MHGAAADFVGRVTNDFDEGYPNCRIAFVLTRGKYSVDSGRIDTLTSSDDGKITVLTLRADIRAKRSVSVKVTPRKPGERSMLDVENNGVIRRVAVFHQQENGQHLFSRGSARRLHSIETPTRGLTLNHEERCTGRNFQDLFLAVRPGDGNSG